MRLYKLRLYVFILYGIICFNIYYCQEIDIVYTNNTYGFLQPCSCPGAPFGGLNRRGTVLKMIRPEADRSILLDAGDLFSHLNEEEKNQAVSDIYLKMNYDAVNIGENEIAAGIEFIKNKEKNIPFFSGNLVSRLNKANIFKNTLIIEKKGVKTGVLGIISNNNASLAESISNLNIESQEPVSVLKKDITELQGKVDFIVLLSRLTFEENIKLAQNTEGIDLIIGGSDFKPNEEALKIRKTLLVQSGVKGHYVGKITLSKKQDFHPVNKLFTLDKTVSNDPEIQGMIDAFEKKLADSQLKRLQSSNKYQGSIYCKGCHENEYNKWNSTRHSRALESLKKEGKDRVIGCLSCHTLGYNLEGETGVQCEHCHVMLIAHDKNRTEPIGVSRKLCLNCHTFEQDPAFDYIEYLKKVLH